MISVCKSVMNICCMVKFVQVWSIASSDDGRWLASGGADSLICLWKVFLIPSHVIMPPPCSSWQHIHLHMYLCRM